MSGRCEQASAGERVVIGARGGGDVECQPAQIDGPAVDVDEFAAWPG
ncbi:hypothetical protein [Pseudonocardia xishanensis]